MLLKLSPHYVFEAKSTLLKRFEGSAHAMILKLKIIKL